jgi:hypothetical protein
MLSIKTIPAPTASFAQRQDKRAVPQLITLICAITRLGPKQTLESHSGGDVELGTGWEEALPRRSTTARIRGSKEPIEAAWVQ